MSLSAKAKNVLEAISAERNNGQRKNVERNWYTIAGNDPREIALISKKSSPEIEGYDLMTVRVLRKDGLPGFWAAMNRAPMSIDEAVELYNSEAELATQGYKINPVNVFYSPERKNLAVTKHTLFIAFLTDDHPSGYEEVEGDMGAPMVRCVLGLLQEGYGTEYVLTGPKAETKEMALKRWKDLFYRKYYKCHFETDSSTRESITTAADTKADSDAAVGLPACE